MKIEKTFTVITVCKKNGCTYPFTVNATSPAKAVGKVEKVHEANRFHHDPKWSEKYDVAVVIDGAVTIPNQPAGSKYGITYVVTI